MLLANQDLTVKLLEVSRGQILISILVLMDSSSNFALRLALFSLVGLGKFKSFSDSSLNKIPLGVVG